MRISPIVFRLRSAISDFAIAGAAELDIAIKNVLKKNMMFVVPISEICNPNNYDSGINQLIVERFAVIIAIANDTSDKEKTGVLAYDRLHDIRSQIFKAILGYEIYGAESIIYYRGGNLWGINNAYLWYQFDFEFTTRIEQFDGYYDIISVDDEVEEQFKTLSQVSQLPDLNKIVSEYISWPSNDIPWTGEIPINTDVVNMTTMVDFTEDTNAGSYGRGFGEDFDFYKILNRK